MVDYLDEFKQFLNEDEKNEEDESEKKFIEDKDIYDIVDNESFFTINSRDRNLINETAFNFSINFGTNNPTKINIGKNFKNIVEVEFLGLIIPDLYVDIVEAFTFHMTQIISTKVAVANRNDPEPKPIRLKRVSDLPYLLLNITEIKNTNSLGSNQAINNSSFVLVLDEVRELSDNNSGFMTFEKATRADGFGEIDLITTFGDISKTIVPNTPKKNLYFKCFTNSSIKYKNPQNYLGNIQLSLTTPEGKALKNLNNFLEVYRVYRRGGDAGTNRLVIKFYNYFSTDEYRIGDRILFKDIGFPVDESIQYNEERIRNENPDITNDELEALKLLHENNGFTNPNFVDRYSSIIQFLEREEGHTIIEVGGQPFDSEVFSFFPETRLFSEIAISFNSQFDLDTRGDFFTNQVTQDTMGMAPVARGIISEQIIASNSSANTVKVKDLVFDPRFPIQAGDVIDCIGIDRVETKSFTSLEMSGGTFVASNPTMPMSGLLFGTTERTDIIMNVDRQSNIISPGVTVTFHRPNSFFKDGLRLREFNGLSNDNIDTSNTHNIFFSKGKCINLSNQTTLGLKIINKEKQLKSFNTELL